MTSVLLWLRCRRNRSTKSVLSGGSSSHQEVRGAVSLYRLIQVMRLKATTKTKNQRESKPLRCPHAFLHTPNAQYCKHETNA